LTVIAKFTAKPDHADAVGEGLLSQLDQTRAEGGSIGYALNEHNCWTSPPRSSVRADQLDPQAGNVG
jgi:quinol monooxygenase YgiN